LGININILKQRLKEIPLTLQREIISGALDFLPDTSFVSDKVAEERLEICESCYNLDPSSRKCNLCGCFVDLKAKVKKLPFMDNEACDLDKW